MTDPLFDDPEEGLAGQRSRIGRDLVAAVAMLAGLALLGAVLASVDLRLGIGLGAVVLIAGGLWLGRDDDEVT